MQHPIDLHAHTRCSDGLLTPTELVAKAVADGVTTLAVTDHDSLAGLDEAQAAAAGTGLRIVPGIELSVTHAERDFHVLGLFVDPADATLRGLLEGRRTDRIGRVHEILGKLATLGIRLTFEAVAAHSEDVGVLGRPHVARALIAAGHATGIDDAFRRYLATGAAAYVPYPKLASHEGIAAIHAAGGVASLAHPGIDDGDREIEGFVAAGVDALEAYHPSHGDRERRHYAQRAQALGLLVSGGSDFHGVGKNHELTLGRPGCPPEAFAALEARAARLAEARAER